jgi:hypothetical protein
LRRAPQGIDQKCGNEIDRNRRISVVGTDLRRRGSGSEILIQFLDWFFDQFMRVQAFVAFRRS